jgi:hypothetical protein
MSENKYVVLCETSGSEMEQWYYFLKYNGNETMLKYLQDQLEKVDMFILDDMSTFDLDLDHFLSETTAKEMTKIEINSVSFHRKFDGKLNAVNCNLKAKDSTERKLEKINKMLADGGIENFIDLEDENSDLSSEDESESSDSDSDNECLVPVPDMAREESHRNSSGSGSSKRLPEAVQKVAGMRRKK